MLVGRRSTDRRPTTRTRLADEERGHYQGDGGQQLHENVERRTGGVLERVADGVADDGRLVRQRLLADHFAVVIEQVTRLYVLLGVVPGSAAVVENGGEQDAGDRTDHQQTSDGLVAEQDADEDRSGDGDDAREHHLAEGGAGRDVNDTGVVRAAGVIHDPRDLAELATDFDDDRLSGRADCPDRQ